MRNYRNVFLGLLVLWCVVSPLCTAARESGIRSGKANFTRRFRERWSNRPLTVRQEIRSNQVTGSFPNSKTVEKCAEKFYKTLEYLPEELIVKSGLKYVTFLHELKLNDQYAGGVAGGNTIYLMVNFNEATVYHEFFHIFDPKAKDEKWRNLNDKSFSYTGSKFYQMDYSKKELRKIKKNIRKDRIQEGFVTTYAMSFEHEDRAETFAYMIVEGKKFLKRTRNPVMKAKMEYIMELFVQRKLLDQAFWDKHFDNKFKVKNRFYSNGK